MQFKAPTPTPPGLWRRTPPAIFPPVMGLFGLGLAWRRAGEAFALPPGIAEVVLGATALLFAFSALAYGAKILRRPGALTDDLRILPGRAGVAALVLCIYLMAMALTPYAPGAAWLVLLAGLGLHAGLIVLVVVVFVRGPAEQRRVSPVWHLVFVGPVIAALAAFGLDVWPLTLALGAVTGMVAIAVWSVSLDQMSGESVPAPLRPLLAIHLAPAAILGLVAHALELDLVATGFAWLALAMLAALLVSGRWVAAAGFSPLWGAFTFPLAASAALWLAMGGAWRWPGGVVLAAATVVVPLIAARVIRAWMQGQLAIRTNASIA